jgi:hypothetical protein
VAWLDGRGDLRHQWHQGARPPLAHRGPSTVIGQSLCERRTLYTVGLIFWLWRKKFVGSYLFFKSTSRA